MQLNLLSLQRTTVVFRIVIFLNVLNIQWPYDKCSITRPVSTQQGKTCYFLPPCKNWVGSPKKRDLHYKVGPMRQTSTIFHWSSLALLWDESPEEKYRRKDICKTSLPCVLCRMGNLITVYCCRTCTALLIMSDFTSIMIWYGRFMYAQKLARWPA